jgi:nitronate monooxygenase
VYGEKDEVNLNAFRKLELPFWLAGGYGSPEKLQEALDEGAQGIQVGTAFAYCDESGFDDIVREKVVTQVLEGDVDVLTSAVASPTGFPFKVVQLPGTIADHDIYMARERICDIGYLRHLYKDEAGHIGYRCPAEPVDAFIKKGGVVEETYGRVCLCNHLGAAAGLPQVRKQGYREPVIVTSGDDLPYITRFIPEGQSHYSANDVLDVLLGV